MQLQFEKILIDYLTTFFYLLYGTPFNVSIQLLQLQIPGIAKRVLLFYNFSGRKREKTNFKANNRKTR